MVTCEQLLDGYQRNVMLCYSLLIWWKKVIEIEKEYLSVHVCFAFEISDCLIPLKSVLISCSELPMFEDVEMEVI